MCGETLPSHQKISHFQCFFAGVGSQTVLTSQADESDTESCDELDRDRHVERVCHVARALKILSNQ